VENKRLGAVLQHIQHHQALRPQYRSEHAPRRRVKSSSPFQAGAALSQKRREQARLRQRVKLRMQLSKKNLRPCEPVRRQRLEQAQFPPC
jgi:hypothetical protein